MDLFQPVLRKFIKPSETTLYWEYLAPGFSTATQDLKAIDLHPNIRKRIISNLELLQTKSRNRQLHKFTGWPRIEYLLSVFPDAKFIHIFRDGRAVANSLFEVKWWHGWQGPQNWIWGPLPVEYQMEWDESNQAFIVLAAIQWKILMDAYENAKKVCPPDNIIELKYEEIVENPIDSFTNVLDICDLDQSKKFIDYIKSFKLKSTNDKWKKNLTIEQQQLLQKSLADHLEKYGYELV